MEKGKDLLNHPYFDYKQIVEFKSEFKKKKFEKLQAEMGIEPEKVEEETIVPCYLINEEESVLLKVWKVVYFFMILLTIALYPIILNDTLNIELA